MDKLGLKNFYKYIHISIFCRNFNIANNGFVMNIMGKVCQQPTQFALHQIDEKRKRKSETIKNGGQKHVC